MISLPKQSKLVHFPLSFTNVDTLLLLWCVVNWSIPNSIVVFQLIIYAGPNTNAKKVAEYGGNTYGFGSRSVLGSGWPKDLVKVCVASVCKVVYFHYYFTSSRFSYPHSNCLIRCIVTCYWTVNVEIRLLHISFIRLLRISFTTARVVCRWTSMFKLGLHFAVQGPCP